VEALESYSYELAPEILHRLHGIHDIDTYFHRMQLPASQNNGESESGLWGDTFFIRWLAKWLGISIGIWSVKNKTRYLLFNGSASNCPYSVLFDDTNPLSGHYEPLLYNKICIVTPVACASFL